MSEKFNQRLIYRYDTLGQLTSFTLFNLDDRIYLTRYYRNDTILAEVLKADYDKVKITLPDSESIELGFNPYISGPPPLAVWNEYLAKNLDYPVSARRAGNSGTVVIAIKINEMGKLVEFELANPEHTARDLGREALRVVEKYDGF
jgi:TonB family protein